MSAGSRHSRFCRQLLGFRRQPQMSAGNVKCPPAADKFSPPTTASVRRLCFPPACVFAAGCVFRRLFSADGCKLRWRCRRLFLWRQSVRQTNSVDRCSGSDVLPAAVYCPPLAVLWRGVPVTVLLPNELCWSAGRSSVLRRLCSAKPGRR